MTLRRLQYGTIAIAVLLFAWNSAYADSVGEDYRIRPDVMNSGGVDYSKSLNYLLSDSIGEPIVGPGQSANYRLDSGYRQQSAADFLSMTCSATALIGSAAGTGQRTGSGTCVVYTDAYGGYNLSWAILSGSGGVNTGSLINQYNDTIAPFDFSRSGLVAHWKTDETVAGSTVKDYSGSGLNGTPNGAGGANNLPQPSLDLPSNMNVSDTRSLSHDGTDDYVDFGTSAALSPANMSFSFWTRNNVTPAQFDALLLRSSGTSWADGWGVWYDSQTIIKFYVGAWNVSFASATIAPKQWNHVAGTWDGTTIKIYVNGVIGTNGSKSGAQTGTTQMLATRGASDAFNFNGQIDDIRVYNRALTAAEITALYRTPHTWSVASNVAGWGSRLRSNSTDTDAKWGTDGVTDKWLNIGDGNYSVVTRGSATSQAGSTEIFQFRGEIGSAVLQPTGSYQATAIFTVVGY